MCRVYYKLLHSNNFAQVSCVYADFFVILHAKLVRQA